MIRKVLPPPAWALFIALAMLALHRFWPGATLLTPPWTAVGALPAASGLALAIAAARLFVKARTALEPWKQPTAFVATGPYRLTRNPMYLGLASGLLGFALWLGSLTPMLLLPVFPLVITHMFIRPEEAGLEALFGEPYRRYKARVRRWI